MTQILYIRHGEVPGNDPLNKETYAYTGSRTDDSLTPKGRVQAQECADKIASLIKNGVLRPPSVLYASPLKRSLETGEAIAAKIGLKVEPRPDLREIDWGDADGKPVQDHPLPDCKLLYPDRKTRWEHLPGFKDAESYFNLLQRTIEELTFLAKKHPEETLIVVGHGRVLKTLIADRLNSEDNIPYPSNCGIAEFSYSAEEGLKYVKIV